MLIWAKVQDSVFKTCLIHDFLLLCRW